MPDNNSTGELAGRRVLMAEDEMAVALAMNELLETTGCEVVKTARCQQGLDYLQAGETFDAAILDITLKDCPVYPLAEALAAEGVPFTFLSGYSSSHLPAEWQDQPILEKPADPDILINWLARNT